MAGFTNGALIQDTSAVTSTWTPTIESNGGAGSGYVYVNQYGIYTEIGNMVWVTGDIEWNSGTGGSGAIHIAGLPFTVNGASREFAVAGVFVKSLTFPGTATNLVIFPQPGTTYCLIQGYESASAAVPLLAWEAGGAISFSLMYRKS